VGVVIGFLVLVVGLSLGWEIYQYLDLRAIGHSTLYGVGKGIWD